MSVHKDKKTRRWYVSCRYDNWDGAKKKNERGLEQEKLKAGSESFCRLKVQILI